MIKNILFDMGQVLIKWDPEVFMDRLGITGEDRIILKNEIFRSTGWVQMDRGALNEEEFLKEVFPYIPERLHDAARRLTLHWDEPSILPMDHMEELVEKLDKNGYNLYLLSNASVRHPQYWPHIPVSKYFGDHLAVSYALKVIKPEMAFFDKTLSMFGLKADECIFTDDSPINTEAAIRCGIKSIVFHGDTRLLTLRLREAGVNVG